MTIMHIVVSNLTAVMLAAHALLGCCWHHGHGSEQMGSPVAVLASSGHCEAGDAHGPSLAQHDCGTQHGERPNCQGSPCMFIGPATQNISPSAVCALQPLVATLPPASLSAGGAAIERSLLAAGALLPPVRLHLAHQVLLI